MGLEVRTTATINRLLTALAVQAERFTPEELAAAYVPIAALDSQISSERSQVVYGRRGAGKTHTLKHLAAKVAEQGALSLYIDLRTVGSANAIYGDTSLSLAQRATALLTDVVKAIHWRLVEIAVDDASLEPLFDVLDSLLRASDDLQVTGPVKVGVEAARDSGIELSGDIQADATLSDKPSLAIKRSRKQSAHLSRSGKRTREVSGQVYYRVHLGELHHALRDAIREFPGRKLWIILDEWSALPEALQPYLADLLRRAILTHPEVVTKIGAIEHRSKFRIQTAGGAIGLELGADLGATISIDDFFLELYDEGQVRDFYAQLISAHFSVISDRSKNSISLPWKDLVDACFADGALHELVRSAGGVPRDTLQLVGLSATLAGDSRISPGVVRKAAQSFYIRDKVKAVEGDPELERLWARLIDATVLGEGVDAFIIPGTAPMALKEGINRLYDARLIHAADAHWGGLAFGDRLYRLDHSAVLAHAAVASALRGFSKGQKMGEIRRDSPTLPQPIRFS